MVRVILPRVPSGSGLSPSGLAHQTLAVPDPEGLCMGVSVNVLYWCISGQERTRIGRGTLDDMLNREDIFKSIIRKNVQLSIDLHVHIHHTDTADPRRTLKH